MDKYPWQSHYNKRRQQRRPQPKARQPLKQKAYAIPKQSKKEVERQKKYRPIAKEFKLLNPICKCGRIDERTGKVCRKATTDVHHTKGKIGELLFDVRWFLPVARVCHNWINDHPDEAEAMGLSFSRLAI